MGCSCLLEPPLPEEVKKILKTLEEKAPDILDKCINEKGKIEDAKKELLKKRDTSVGEAKDQSEEELKKLLINYNKKELNKDKKLIANEVDKMHSLWELGIELADPLKNFIINELTEKKSKAPEFMKEALNSQISEIKAFSAKEFLNSKFGKPLKEALIKQGLSKNLLDNYKKELVDDRKKRREEEREKYSYVKQNEFPPEDEFEFKIDDLYDSIFDEYKDAFMPKILKDLLKTEEEEDEGDED